MNKRINQSHRSDKNKEKELNEILLEIETSKESRDENDKYKNKMILEQILLEIEESKQIRKNDKDKNDIDNIINNMQPNDKSEEELDEILRNIEIIKKSRNENDEYKREITVDQILAEIEQSKQLSKDDKYAREMMINQILLETGNKKQERSETDKHEDEIATVNAKPKIKSKPNNTYVRKYTGKCINRMRNLAKAFATGIYSLSVAIGLNMHSADKFNKNYIEQTIIPQEKELKEEITSTEISIKEDLIENSDITKIENSIESNSVENTSISKIDKVDNNSTNKIETIYGGEISASENGIRTEEQILYTVNEMGWRKEEIKNIKEMMDGLLSMQRDFDIDPLCAIAVFHWESHCGVAYQNNGEYRVANVSHWKGEKGVVGHSKDGYGQYSDFASAAYDFGNYVRNSTALKGAKSMNDLESFNGYSCIFEGAATSSSMTYEKLKNILLEKYSTKISIENIEELVENCKKEELEQTTNYIKEKYQNRDKENQQNKGEANER